MPSTIHEPIANSLSTSEGGLHAPTSLSFWGRVRWWLRLIFIVQLARLRFLLILGVIGFAIIKWDLLLAYYEKWTRPADTEIVSSDLEYFCPMHPTIVRDTNKEKCPICFMPLSKRKKGDITEEALPAGTVSRVQLSPYRVVLAGIRMVPVDYHRLHKDITTVGIIEFDERNLRNVSARVKGRIEKLFVNQTGQQVQKNEPLATLYSPDLVVTVQNLLDARAAQNRDLEKDARDRLLLWGIDQEQIDSILKTGKPINQLTIRSPIDGHVIKKYPREGQYVEEGISLYDVADLSTVWIQAQLYEEDLAFLPKGIHDPKTGAPIKPLTITATTPALPGEQFSGAVSFIFPHIDAESRTLTVRFEVKNPDHELRPGMTAAVTLKLSASELRQLPMGRRLRIQEDKLLAIPEGSVIDTGSQKIVYRQSIPGTFEGIRVELGSRLSGPNGEIYYPILNGLEAKDQIVTSGAFLVDAETRLNPAMGSIYIGGSNSGKTNAPAPIRPTTPEDEDQKISASLQKLPPEDQKLAQQQRFCAILDGSRLGSMGIPIKLNLNKQDVFICCKGCIKEAQEETDKTLQKAEALRTKSDSPRMVPKSSSKEEKIRKALDQLSPEDRTRAQQQRLCPITEQPLGSMGKPFKLTIQDRVLFLCCEGCVDQARSKPQETLRKVDTLLKPTLKK